MTRLQSLNQPKMSAREFYSIFITITVWNKFKMLLHFHHYLKDNFLVPDYMRHFYIQMVFLGSEFSIPLFHTPVNVMKYSWTHSKSSGKILDLFLLPLNVSLKV